MRLNWSKVYGKRYQWGPGVAVLMVAACALLLYAPQATEQKAGGQTSQAPPPRAPTESPVTPVTPDTPVTPGTPDTPVDTPDEKAPGEGAPLVPELNRAVLKETDFEYQGAFALPKYAHEWSTAWAVTGITCRRVGGQLRFITGAAIWTGDAPYEVAYPGVSKEYGNWPEAKFTNEWGYKLYGNQKIITADNEYGITAGFHYSESNKRLYFSFGSYYNVTGENHKALGYATLEPTLANFGSWNAPEARAHSQKIRGGALTIPKWFAKTYTGGRCLGLGFGGAYAGIAQCSKGPFLTAAFHPSATTKQLDVFNLIDYPNEHWGTRNANYTSDISWVPNPVDGVGFWGAQDFIYGGATWIDLPDKHGMIYVTTLGEGRIHYTEGAIYCDKVQPWWWVYDPRSLAEVAQGKKKPWDHKPASWKVTYTPRDGEGYVPMETTGCCFDAASRTLFVLVPMSYNDGNEIYPLVHAYKVK